MGPSARSSFSFQHGPFPVAVVDELGEIFGTNEAWDKVATSTEHSASALGLTGSDADDFTATIGLVAHDQTAAWVDVVASVLHENRRARCHMWPQSSRDGVIVAVIPHPDNSDSDLSQLQIDHIERILGHTADAITIVTADMTFRFASGIAMGWSGMSGSGYKDLYALNIVFVDDHQSLLEAFARCVEEPHSPVKARFRAIEESGDLIWVEGIGTNMFDDPVIQGILVTLNDITELVEARAAAEFSQAELEAEKQHF